MRAPGRGAAGEHAGAWFPRRAEGCLLQAGRARAPLPVACRGSGSVRAPHALPRHDTRRVSISMWETGARAAARGTHRRAVYREHSCLGPCRSAGSGRYSLLDRARAIAPPQPYAVPVAAGDSLGAGRKRGSSIAARRAESYSRRRARAAPVPHFRRRESPHPRGRRNRRALLTPIGPLRARTCGPTTPAEGGGQSGLAHTVDTVLGAVARCRW